MTTWPFQLIELQDLKPMYLIKIKLDEFVCSYKASNHYKQVFQEVKCDRDYRTVNQILVSWCAMQLYLHCRKWVQDNGHKPESSFFTNIPGSDWVQVVVDEDYIYSHHKSL
ncbi:Hypothetical protein CINCED_3A012098 [Cinara cedri]|uniref:Uncharacterized protein n=1 Tax=Cinara cedri TaxID=506608 RepID=A0A5E4MW47_9HEMI|nr:Hypothetical protein CINCED_3A012098 [Cinara cedri]